MTAGASPVAPGELLAGRYRVEELVASGGMADVYRATDDRLGRPVALKVFRAGTADRRRFANEVATLASLQHPHLLAVLDAVNRGDRPFVVLELHPGTLADRDPGAPMPPEEVARLGVGVASALAHVHERGIVHRDVKPSNILVTSEGRPLLGDFGVARVVDSTRITSTSITVGTLAYLAPEQLTGEPVGPPADVYALGLVLLELLAGRRVFDGNPAELLAQRAQRDVEVPASVPPAWAPLLASMTHRDPRRRPTAAEVVVALERLRDDAPAATAPLPVGVAPVTERAPGVVPVGSPRRLGRVAAAAAALVALVAVVLAARGDGPEPVVTPPAVATTAVPAAAAPTAAATSAPPADVVEEAPPAPAADDLAAACERLEERRRDLERQKQQIEEQYRDDRETRERLKAELADLKAALDEERRAIGCGG